MEGRLLEKFQEKFYNLNKETREEDLLLFLDKRSVNKFDRDVFNQLTTRIGNEHKSITPFNFVKTYNLAHTVLQNKKNRAENDRSNLMNAYKNLQNNPNIMKVHIQNLNVERISDDSNYLSFKYDKNFVTSYSPQNEDDTDVILFLPNNNLKNNQNLDVYLLNGAGKTIDIKTVTISLYSNNYESITFKDNTSITFDNMAMDSNLSELGRYYKTEDNKYNTLINYCQTEKTKLESPFPDVYLNKSLTKTSNKKFSCLLITCLLLTLSMLILTLILNFSRCVFIDIFVSIAFVSNVYIWRIFNIFLALRLIGIMAVSIIIDLTWEIMRLVHYTTKYESNMKYIRLLGLIFSFINIVIKIVLCILYLKLAREKQEGGYLAIEDENSINEVDENDYLVNLTEKKPFDNKKILTN
jgi:hypothetical protein